MVLFIVGDGLKPHIAYWGLMSLVWVSRRTWQTWVYTYLAVCETQNVAKNNSHQKQSMKHVCKTKTKHKGIKHAAPNIKHETQTGVVNNLSAKIQLNITCLISTNIINVTHQHFILHGIAH